LHAAGARPRIETMRRSTMDTGRMEGIAMKIASTMPRLLLALIPMLVIGCGSTSYDQTTTPGGTTATHVDARLGKSLSADSTGIGTASDRFSPNETVYAVIDVPPSTTGRTMDVRWVYGASGGQTVAKESVTIVPGTTSYHVDLTPPDGGNKPGDYQLEISMNGDRVETERFTVSPQ
jgi:hypothetical protein